MLFTQNLWNETKNSAQFWHTVNSIIFVGTSLHGGETFFFTEQFTKNTNSDSNRVFIGWYGGRPPVYWSAAAEAK